MPRGPLQPLSDVIEDYVVDLLLRDPDFLRNLERVVAALDDKDFGGASEVSDDRLQLFGRSERIARALHEQHGRADAPEMF